MRDMKLRCGTAPIRRRAGMGARRHGGLLPPREELILSTRITERLPNIYGSFMTSLSRRDYPPRPDEGLN